MGPQYELASRLHSDAWNFEMAPRIFYILCTLLSPEVPQYKDFVNIRLAVVLKLLFLRTDGQTIFNRSSEGCKRAQTRGLIF